MNNMVWQKQQTTSKAELFVVQKDGSVKKEEMDLNFPCKLKGKVYIVTSQDCVPYLVPNSETQQDKHMDARDAVGFRYGMSSKVCGVILKSEVRLLLSPSEIHRLNSSFNIIGFYKALTNRKEDLESLFNAQGTQKRSACIPDNLISLASRFLCSSDADHIKRFIEKLNQRFTDKVTEQCLTVEDPAKALVFGVLLTLVAAEVGASINPPRNIQDKIEEINIPGDSDYNTQLAWMVTTFQMAAELLPVPHQGRNVFILFRNPTPDTWVTGGVTDLDSGTQITYGLCNKLFSVSGQGWEVQFLQNLQECYDMTSIFHLSGFAHHLLMDPDWRKNLASLQTKEHRAEVLSKLCDLAVRFLHDNKYRHTFTKYFRDEIEDKCSNGFPVDGCGQILLGMLVAVKAALIARDINDGKIRVCDEPLGGVHSTQQQIGDQNEDKKPSAKTMTPPGVKRTDHTGVQDTTHTADTKEVTSPQSEAHDPSQRKAEDQLTESIAHDPSQRKAEDQLTESKAHDPLTEPKEGDSSQRKADDPSSEPKAADPPTEPKAADPPSESKAADPPSEPKAADPPTEPKAADPPNEPKAADPRSEPKAADPPTEPKAADPPSESKAADPPTEPKAAYPSTEPKAAYPPTEPKSADPSTEPKSADPPTEPKAADPPTEPKAASPSTKPNAYDHPPVPNIDETSVEPREYDPSEPKLDELPPEANSAPNVEDSSPTLDMDMFSSGPYLDDHSHAPETVNSTSAPKNINPAPVPVADDASPPVEANGEELKRNAAVPRGNEDTARVSVEDSTPVMIVEDASAPGNFSAAVPIPGDVGVEKLALRIPFSSQARNVKTEDSAVRKDVIREHPENAVTTSATSSGGLSPRLATVPLGRGRVLGVFIAVVLLYFFIDSLSGILPKTLQILLSLCVAFVVALFVLSIDQRS